MICQGRKANLKTRQKKTYAIYHIVFINICVWDKIKPLIRILISIAEPYIIYICILHTKCSLPKAIKEYESIYKS